MVMAEIGGPLAHQLPLHHRSGLIQPSLVMNHHIDLDCHGGHEIHATNISEYSFLSNSEIF